MKFKKLISLSLTMIVSAGILVGCGSSDGDSATEGKIKVGMITDVGGVHDESFNQSSWEGLQAIQKELGEDEDISSEAEVYREKLKKIKAPKETKEKIAPIYTKVNMIAFDENSKLK